MVRRSKEQEIRNLFVTLFRAWGRQHWWPAESRFEVIVGAFLTQNTAWTNVERALENLRNAGALSLAGVRTLPLPELEQLIRPSGYFRQKAQRLKTFIAHLDQTYGGSLEKMFAQPTNQLRAELLSLNGIGPETADSILLYAGNHEVFVVDAYTRRVLGRHGILPETARYEDVRTLMERALTPEFAIQVEHDDGHHHTLAKPPGGPPSSFAHEHREPLVSGPTFQRDARPIRRSRKKLLPEPARIVRSLPAL